MFLKNTKIKKNNLMLCWFEREWPHGPQSQVGRIAWKDRRYGLRGGTASLRAAFEVSKGKLFLVCSPFLQLMGQAVSS